MSRAAAVENVELAALVEKTAIDSNIPPGVTAASFFSVASQQRLWIKRRVYSHRLREDGCNHTRISLDMDLPPVLWGSGDRSEPALLLVPVTWWLKDRPRHRIDIEDAHGQALRLAHSEIQARLVWLQLFAEMSTEFESLPERDIASFQRACIDVVVEPVEEAERATRRVARKLKQLGASNELIEYAKKHLGEFTASHLVAVLLPVAPGQTAAMVKYNYGLGSGELTPHQGVDPRTGADPVQPGAAPRATQAKRGDGRPEPTPAEKNDSRFGAWKARIAEVRRRRRAAKDSWSVNPVIEIHDRDHLSAATTHYEIEVTGDVLLRTLAIVKGEAAEGEVFDDLQHPLERAQSIALRPIRLSAKDMDTIGKGRYRPATHTRIRTMVIPKASGQTRSARTVAMGSFGIAAALTLLSLDAWLDTQSWASQLIPWDWFWDAHSAAGKVVSPQLESGSLQFLVTAAAAGAALASREPEHAVTSWALRAYRVVTWRATWCLAATAAVIVVGAHEYWWMPLTVISAVAAAAAVRVNRASRWELPRGRRIAHSPRTAPRGAAQAVSR